MRITIYRGTDETAPWETREVTFECFAGAKVSVHWSGLGGSMSFWLNAGKGHSGGQACGSPSWAQSWHLRTKDLATLKTMRETEKRAAKKSKKTVAA